MAQAPKVKAQSTQQVMNTAAKNLANAQKAGILPAPKVRKAKAPKGRTARGTKPRTRNDRSNTPMVKKVRKLEHSTAMY